MSDESVVYIHVSGEVEDLLYCRRCGEWRYVGCTERGSWLRFDDKPIDVGILEDIRLGGGDSKFTLLSEELPFFLFSGKVGYSS